ncbi:Yin, partial [Operophtera brumata]
CFVAGKKLYVIKTPAGNVLGKVSTCIGREHWLDNADDKYDRGLIEDIKSLLRVLVLFIPLPVFWALFDQQGSRWTFQADRMEQDIGSWTLKADQMQVLNPLLILIFIPLFEVAIYPFMTKCRLISKPLHKMIWGGLLAAAAFVISGIVELNLLPTYGTPLVEGYSQLRVYNGFNCNYTFTSFEPYNNSTSDFNIGPLSVYENLEMDAITFPNISYALRGVNGECIDNPHIGSFSVSSSTANSFFINNQGIHAFVDNNDKPIDGVYVRFLVNSARAVPVTIVDSSKNRTKLSLDSNDKGQKKISKGSGDIIVDGQTVLKDFKFRAGAVYTINVYNDSNSIFVANPLTITPPNSVHILWLIPQYVVMTMGEVMFSVTGLEFSFTQAPATMKSVLQSVWLLTVAFGNLIVVLIVEGHFLNAQVKNYRIFYRKNGKNC